MRPDWMMVDTSHVPCVAACFGDVPYRVGDTLSPELFEEGRDEICLEGIQWAVFSRFARTTDCVWLIRLPLSDTQYRQVMECFPRQVDMDGEEEEILRLLRHIYRLCGVSLRLLGERVPPMPEMGIARAPVDISFLAVMLLVLVGMVADHGLVRCTAILYRVREGIALRLDFPCSVGAEELPHCDGAVRCRRWAEERGQIFTFRYEARQLHLSLCAVNKDVSLLGIKTETTVEEER